MNEDDFDLADERYAEAAELWDTEGPVAAKNLLLEVIALDPDHADAHYGLGLCLELEGDLRGAVVEFLEARRLDELFDEEVGIDNPEGLALVAELAEAALASIPEKFRDRLENVPVVLEARPAVHLVREGFDPRSLGLFEGHEDAQRDQPQTAPTRIVLYYANLLADFGHPEDDPALLAEQIETTVLHEVAHFFGLDEDEVAELGLE